MVELPVFRADRDVRRAHSGISAPPATSSCTSPNRNVKAVNSFISITETAAMAFRLGVCAKKQPDAGNPTASNGSDALRDSVTRAVKRTPSPHRR
jgi:hypothetical protein